MQGLGGMGSGLNRGASMSGNKSGAYSDPNPVKYARLGSGTSATAVNLTITSPGLYQIVVDGGGGNVSTNAGGGSGGKVVKVARFRKDEVVALSIGGQTNNTTATLPDGTVLTAGAGGNSPGIGVAGPAGTASGGDTNLPGAAGSTTGPNYYGGTSPSYLGFIGGGPQASPGGGGNPATNQPGYGQAIITKIGE